MELEQQKQNKKQNKKQHPAGGKLCLLLVCGLLVLAAAGCGKQPPEELDQRDKSLMSELISKEPQPFVVAFFPDKNSGNLVPLSFSVNATRDIVWLALEKMLGGPPNDSVDAVLPTGIKLQDVYYDEAGINLFLQGEEALTAADINVEAISATIHYGIYEQGQLIEAPLKIFYNDQALLTEPYWQSYVNDYSGNAEQAAYVVYSDSQALNLVPLRLAMKQTGGDDFYQELLSKWAAQPPKNSGVNAVVYEGTQVLNCFMQEDCLVVDLNQQAVSYGGGTARETMFVNSLVATLRPYEEIKSVKLTIEGKSLDYLPEGTDVSTNLVVPHGHGKMNMVN